MSQRIVHLNTAGAGLAPREVVEVMTAYLLEESERGSYETELRHEDELHRDVYRNLGSLVNAAPEDLSIFDSATRAWCSVICNLSLRPTDRVWVTPYEYAGNLIALANLRDRFGFTLEVVPLQPGGDLDLEWMQAHVDERVALACVTHVPSGCGIVNPLKDIGSILAPSGCWFAVDACQSVGQVPIDVAAAGCHLLTGAGRKFLRGPRGIGFAYIARQLRDQVALPFHDLQVTEMRWPDGYSVTTHGARLFELAERNNAAIAGFNAALAHHRGADLSMQKTVFARLCEELEAIGSLVTIEPGAVRSGIVSFVHPDLPAQWIRNELAERNINVWVAQGWHTPIYMGERGIETAVRASVHYYNSLDEVETFARALRGILGG